VINDWDAFVEFRDRTRPHANYEINVPRHVVDLSRPAVQATRDAVRWLRGRMEAPSPWMAREQWDALVRGDDCPLCGDIASTETENAYGFFVGDLRMSRLMLAREFHVPGRCVLMCRRHVQSSGSASVWGNPGLLVTTLSIRARTAARQLAAFNLGGHIRSRRCRCCDIQPGAGGGETDPLLEHAPRARGPDRRLRPYDAANDPEL
jgi:hypothetical protein